MFDINSKLLVYFQCFTLRCGRKVAECPSSLDGIRSPVIRTSQPRAHFGLEKLFNEVDVSKIPKQDPEKGTLVYVGTMSDMVKFVKTFSISTSFIGAIGQPYLLFYADNLPMAFKVGMSGVLGFFVFLTPLMLHWVTGRYVTKMYLDYKTNIFTAHYFNLLVTEKHKTFHLDNVEYPEVPGLLTTVKADGKALFLDSNLFLDKNAYIKLMRYDKPIEWTLPPTDVKEDKKQ